MSGKLSRKDQQLLLTIARTTIDSYVTGKTLPPLAEAPPALEEQRGCFVTIKKDGALRGCIGTFTADKPLCRTVQEMAVSAATRDPRFYPMKQADLSEYHLELSVLTPLQKIDSIDEIIIGVHGLYMEKNITRGVLLPQVATEYGWDRETFLRQTCLKAGLRPDEWQDGVTIYIFSADIFSDS